ncbi:hypothetical protein GCM10023340_05960 [Nocardioides marinquilinus]|uniref:Alpha/beta hydrolase n=1 Tax=Nocardioides marinquilinus TaxID=1210400 RepID=A0ABP9P8L5_9ACTN
MTDEQERPPTDQAAVVAAAAAERRTAPVTEAEAADLADKYDRMMRLAALFDESGEEMRRRASLGTDILADPAFTDSAPLAKDTFAQAEDAVREATLGKRGLLSRSIELDADALVLRATVLTYRWIDELQSAAYKTLGSIAGRAIGYLAPQVALGGAIVSAGLIETDALDRDGVAAYLNELADANPELMEHVTTGGGGLLDGLRMRSLLTAGVLAGEQGRLAGRGGLRAAGVEPFAVGFDGALRDVAGGLVDSLDEEAEAAAAAAVAAASASGGDDASTRPRTLTDLMTALQAAPTSVVVHRVAPGRFIAYLPGPGGGSARRLRLVGGDQSGYAAQVVRAVERAVDAHGDDDARVMLVGSAQGGVTATEVASAATSNRFAIDQVVTAGAPSAHVPRIPETTRVLSLEDRSDPVALLGSLINSGVTNRVTVVYDAGDASGDERYVEGARAADAAQHPELLREIRRLGELGYLAG